MRVRLTRLDAGVPIPAYAHPGDAGADLVTAVDVELGPGERALVGTGIAIALPVGFAAFVHPRSGLAALALVRLGRRRVSLTENEHGEQLLRVGTASLPARFIADAVAVAAADKQSLLGPELDPTAFVLHRPWVGPAVRIRLNDPEDPTPYWIFSVRRPEALLECLRTEHPR